TPARRRAAVDAHPPWPSRLVRKAGRSPTTSSRAAADGHPRSNQSWDHPPPTIHSASGWAAAYSAIRRRASSAQLASNRLQPSRFLPPWWGWTWASVKPGVTRRPSASTTSAPARYGATSLSLPTATILPFSTATARAHVRAESARNTIALTITVRPAIGERLSGSTRARATGCKRVPPSIPTSYPRPYERFLAPLRGHAHRPARPFRRGPGRRGVRVRRGRQPLPRRHRRAVVRQHRPRPPRGDRGGAPADGEAPRLPLLRRLRDASHPRAGRAHRRRLARSRLEGVLRPGRLRRRGHRRQAGPPLLLRHRPAGEDRLHRPGVGLPRREHLRHLPRGHRGQPVRLRRAGGRRGDRPLRRRRGRREGHRARRTR